MLRDIGMITITYGKPLALFVAFDSVQSWMALIWILAGAGVVAYAVRRNRPTVLMVFGGMAVAAGWVSYRQALSLEIVLVPEGVLLAATGLLLFIRERLRSHGHP
jgi:hypothetical protein